MKLPIYQIDAFTPKVFGGNPAAIVPLDKWLSDEIMQNIAIENNLSETCFTVPMDDGMHDYHLRYFTPGSEVKFCGHATLAAGDLFMSLLHPEKDKLVCHTDNGTLYLHQDKDFIVMDVPCWTAERIDAPESLIDAFRTTPVSVYEGEYWMLLFDTQTEIENLSPDFRRLNAFNKADAFICTAPGDDKNIDFVSRFFCPGFGIDEDPVTGSAHSIMAPYWAEKLGKTSLTARQLSKRGGEVHCDVKGDRLDIKGQCVLYMRGEIEI